MKRFTARRTALGLALGLISSSALAQDFSQTVFFGDSLTDSGRLQGIINNSIAALFLPETQPSFTTNPDTVWAQHFAKYNGHQANSHTQDNPTGTNYAIGGARAAEQTKQSGLIIHSAKQQADEYLSQTGGKADPNALYSVWVGANDLLAAAEILKNDNTKTLEALGVITNAAKAEADLVEQLHQAGAQVILVPNIPDVGLTPRFVANPAQAAQATFSAKLYNDTLYQNLANKGGNVIPANTFALLQEAVADKEGFGFKNVNDAACNNADTLISSLGCTQANWKTPTANEDYAFADGIHPSGRTHRLVAQYYQSLIDSPKAIGQLPGKLTNDGQSTNRQLNRRLNTLDQHTHSIWVDTDVNNGKFLGVKNDQPAVLMGLDMAGKNSNTGFYLNYHKQDYALSSNTTADVKQLGFGLYHRHDLGKIGLKASAGVDRLDIQTDRQLTWEGAPRSHHSDGMGRRYHAGLQASYAIDAGKSTFSPYLGVHAQKVRVDDLSEDQANLSTALRFHRQTQESLQGQIGVNWQYNLSDKAQLFGGLEHSHEFEDDARSITTSVSSVNHSRGYTLPVAVAQDKDSTNAHLGAKLTLGQANLTLGATAEHKNSDYAVGGFVGLQSKF